MIVPPSRRSGVSCAATLPAARPVEAAPAASPATPTRCRNERRERAASKKFLGDMIDISCKKAHEARPCARNRRRRRQTRTQCARKGSGCVLKGSLRQRREEIRAEGDLSTYRRRYSARCRDTSG